MKFLHLIKSHFYYLSTKRNLIIVVLLNLASLFYFLINSSAFNDQAAIDAERGRYLELYETNSLPFIRIFFVFFVSFINLSFFTGNYSRYAQYYIRSFKTKINFYLTKYLSVIFFDTFEYLILYGIYETIKIILPFGVYPFSDLMVCFKIYLVGIYYLLFSSIFLVITKTYLAALVPIILFWIAESSAQGEQSIVFIKVINIISVTINSNGDFYYGFPHTFFIIFIVLWLNILIVLRKDAL